MDDNAQMMVIEAIIFAIFMVLSLVFLYMMAPSGSVSNVFTDAQKIDTDNALYTLSENYSLNLEYNNYPLNELTHYIVTNDYENLILRLNNLIDIDSQYNIWICNSTKCILWCNSSTVKYESLSLDPKPLETSESIIVSTHIVTLPSAFRDNENSIFDADFFKEGRYYNSKCDLSKDFSGYKNSVYTLVMELW